jgi:hypothetical protein
MSATRLSDLWLQLCTAQTPASVLAHTRRVATTAVCLQRLGDQTYHGPRLEAFKADQEAIHRLVRSRDGKLRTWRGATLDLAR